MSCLSPERISYGNWKYSVFQCRLKIHAFESTNFFWQLSPSLDKSFWIVLAPPTPTPPTHTHIGYFRVKSHKNRGLVSKFPTSQMWLWAPLGILQTSKVLYFPGCSHQFNQNCYPVFKTPVEGNYALCGLESLNHIFFSFRNHQNQERYCVCCQPLLIMSQLKECGGLSCSPPVWLHLTTNACKYWFGSPISRQLSSNVLICIIFKSSIILHTRLYVSITFF